MGRSLSAAVSVVPGLASPFSFDMAKPKLEDFEPGATLGTGSFGRVRLTKCINPDLKNMHGLYYALKILKKSEVIYLKQVEHVKTEKKILDEISHPFIVNMMGAFQ